MALHLAANAAMFAMVWLPARAYRPSDKIETMGNLASSVLEMPFKEMARIFENELGKAGLTGTIAGAEEAGTKNIGSGQARGPQVAAPNALLEVAVATEKPDDAPSENGEDEEEPKKRGGDNEEETQCMCFAKEAIGHKGSTKELDIAVKKEYPTEKECLEGCTEECKADGEFTLTPKPVVHAKGETVVHKCGKVARELCLCMRAEHNLDRHAKELLKEKKVKSEKEAWDESMKPEGLHKSAEECLAKCKCDGVKDKHGHPMEGFCLAPAGEKKEEEEKKQSCGERLRLGSVALVAMAPAVAWASF